MYKSGRPVLKQREDALTLGTTHCQRCNPSLIIMLIIPTAMKSFENNDDENYYDKYEDCDVVVGDNGVFTSYGIHNFTFHI